MHSRQAVFERCEAVIADEPRIAAFERALATTVKPGSVVVDLGSGTGLLSLVACRLGARRVYSLEEGESAELSRRIFLDNGVSDRIVIVRGPYDRVVLPERADVLVCNLLVDLGVEEPVLGVLRDARRRWLREGAAILPSRMQIVAAPFNAPREHAARVGFWDRDLYGLDFRSVRKYGALQLHRTSLAISEPVSTPRSIVDADLTAIGEYPLQGVGEFAFTTRTEVHGLGFWFRALVGDAWISNEPPNGLASVEQRFLPFEEPIQMDAGDSLIVSGSLHEGRTWQWNVDVRSASGGAGSRQIGRGAVLPPDSGSTEVPRSPRVGRLALLLLEQIDRSNASQQSLVQKARAEEPELFRTDRAAEEFISSLLRDYTGFGDPAGESEER